MADSDERDGIERGSSNGGGGGGGTVQSAGGEAIKWSAIVLIVISVLYFLARFVIPLVG